MAIFLGFVFALLTWHLAEMQLKSNVQWVGVMYLVGLWLLDLAILVATVGVWAVEHGKL